MKTKNTNISVFISLALVIITFLFLITFAIFLPSLVDSYLEISQKADDFTAFQVTQIKIIVYIILIPAFIADISLLIILKLVAKGLIFSSLSVYLLRLISLCCFAEVILFGAISIFFLIALVVSFAALFLGIVLRVVKNVIEEATAIKAENDFTV